MEGNEPAQGTQSCSFQMKRTDTSAAMRAIEIRRDLSDCQVNKICDVVRETGFAIHKYFGPGFREKVYARALVHRLAKVGVALNVQPRVMIHDEDGTELVEEIVDLLVDRVLILEIKAVRLTTDHDVAQLLGYLRATSVRHGLLINFGGPKFFIRKYVM